MNVRNMLEPLLLKVRSPSRYIGGELNSVVKNKQDVDVRFAFCFPDSYDIGMSHLGMKILYALKNKRDDFWCERVFAPGLDLEELMRKHDIPLYGLESLDSLDEFDFVAAVGEVVGVAGGEVVEGDDADAAGEEVLADVGADETGAAGDEDAGKVARAGAAHRT